MSSSGREAEAKFHEGISLYKAGRYEEALACYDHALELNPDASYVWSAKGSTLEGLKRYEKALVCCDRALQLDEWDGTGWDLKELILLELGQWEKAREVNRQWSKMWEEKGDHYFYEACDEWGDARLNRDGKNAWDYYYDALVICPWESYCWSQIYDLSHVKRYDEAADWYRDVPQFSSPGEEAQFYRGMVLDRLGRYEEAIACYDRVLQNNPAVAEVWYRKGISLDGPYDRRQEARPCFEEAQRLGHPLASWELEYLTPPV